MSEANSFLDLALSYFNFNPAEVSRQRSVLELDGTRPHSTPRLTFSVFLEAPSSSQVAASWARATDLFTPSPESFCHLHLLALLAANTSQSTMSAIASAQQHTSTPVTGDSVRQVHQNKHLFSKTNKEATISHLILGKFIHFLHFTWKRAFSLYIGGDH